MHATSRWHMVAGWPNVITLLWRRTHHHSAVYGIWCCFLCSRNACFGSLHYDAQQRQGMNSIYRRYVQVNDKVFNDRYGFLTLKFKHGFSHWEVILLIRFCLLTMCLILLHSSAPLQTMGAGIVLFGAAQLQQNYKVWVWSRLDSLLAIQFECIEQTGSFRSYSQRNHSICRTSVLHCRFSEHCTHYIDMGGDWVVD